MRLAEGMSQEQLEGKAMDDDDRIKIVLSKIKDEHVKEIALKQLEALALLG